MANDIKSILEQSPIDNSGSKSYKRPPIDAVDRLADSLVAEYDNPDYRKWYCKVIYEFGPSQVLEWRSRAKEGNEPAKLFTKYVSDVRKFKAR